MRKNFSIAGALLGLAYIVYAMIDMYLKPPPGTDAEAIMLQFLFAAFTVPFGAAIGLGLGLLVEGLFKSK